MSLFNYFSICETYCTLSSGEIGINSTMLNGAEIMIPRSISINNCFVLNHAFGITVIHRIDLIT